MPVAASIVFNSKKIIITYFTLSLIILVSVRLLFGEQYIPFYSNEIKGLGDIFAVPNTIFATFLIFMSVRQFKRENLNYQKTVEKQNITLEEKNKEITDSINYAKKIQTALLPSELEFKKNFADSFVLLLPKDIVSGDFYWITEKDNKVFYATADCTGHGVPGGFMTMLGISFLDEIVTEKKHIEVNEILNHLSERIVNTLKQSGNAGENKDGMDIVVCCYNKQTNELSFAAANNSLYLVREKSILEYKADKQPCGFHHDPKPFTKKQIKVQSGDLIVTFTDGFADQFGGDKGKKFKYKQLEELILYSANESLAIQKNSLEKEFINWKGNLEQVDDVLIIAVKIE
jgi:serine phosphatase RsbU (regulator of sigma subunit)